MGNFLLKFYWLSGILILKYVIWNPPKCRTIRGFFNIYQRYQDRKSLGFHMPFSDYEFRDKKFIKIIRCRKDFGLAHWIVFSSYILRLCQNVGDRATLRILREAYIQCSHKFYSLKNFNQANLMFHFPLWFVLLPWSEGFFSFKSLFFSNRIYLQF